MARSGGGSERVGDPERRLHTRVHSDYASRFLHAEKCRWYSIDVGLPFGVALLVAGVFRLFLPMPEDNLSLGFIIVMVSAVTLGATALATPVTRIWVQNKISTCIAF